ncbi:hypothetical protein OB975_09645 [Bacillus cereus]|nr:hypothetical protein BCSJ1_11033 [Bacillus cereus SJ1]MCU4900214.1 hypothetical protein [Bacillus cereus]MEC4696281.1 hypothetical protein [Bacillus anthracis]PRP98885.1 hypothetical protein TUN_20180 [Bacillus sp. M21]MCU5312701.1 hypothetical protein [Bacillus cereus]
MKRKISTAVVGLSVFSFGLFGINIGDGGVVKAEHGETFSPKLEGHADFAAPKLETHADLSSKLDSHGDTWAPSYNRGDGGAPAYDHGRPPISSYNIGDTWAPSYTNTHGEGMAPKKESHADFFAPTLEAHGNTGAPALNVGDTPTPKQEAHGETI